jgi:hypothetical protein
MDALRSEAVGILATPARAMALLAWGERQYRGSEGRRGAGATSMVNAGADPEAFAPPATLYVHLSGDQLLRRTRGAARVKGVGAVTVEQAVDLLRHTRVTVRPVLDLSQTWAVDGYETPPRMREQVTLRWPVEVFPNGTLPARRGDLDHVVPYRPTGPPGRRAPRTSPRSVGGTTASRPTDTAGSIDNPCPACTTGGRRTGTGHASTIEAPTGSAAPSPRRTSSCWPRPRAPSSGGSRSC